MPCLYIHCSTPTCSIMTCLCIHYPTQTSISRNTTQSLTVPSERSSWRTGIPTSCPCTMDFLFRWHRDTQANRGIASAGSSRCGAVCRRRGPRLHYRHHRHWTWTLETHWEWAWVRSSARRSLWTPKHQSQAPQLFKK